MRDPVRRLLMTADAIGGVWTYALELARELTQSGVQVLLAVMGGIPDDRRAEAQTVPGLRLETSGFRLEWMQEPWDDVEGAGAWLLGLAADFQPDLVHLNGYAHAVLPWRIPTLVVAHSCVCSWWRAVKGEAAPGEWDRYRGAVQAGLAAAGCVVAPSQAMLSALEREYGACRHARVIANGRRLSGLPRLPKEPLILTAGRLWDESKNLALLDRVAQTGRLPIYAAGDGGESAQELCFLGRLEPAALNEWYARAAIYASAALYEPFGYAPLEAALAGCALVLSEIPSLREIWGDAALFLPARDAQAWETALTELLNHPARTAELGQRARERARRYSPQNMAREYLDLYQELLENFSPCGSSSLPIRFDQTGTTETRTSSAA